MLEEVGHFPVNLVSKGTEVLGERVKYIYEEKGHTMRFRKKIQKVINEDAFTVQACTSTDCKSGLNFFPGFIKTNIYIYIMT